ncbi:MAG: superoxide dismutase [Crocinitomicaceae bacterium]|jgi:Fe-Mn family superoxide dismutase
MRKLVLILCLFVTIFSKAQEFSLPNLNYSFTSLEPVIDSVTMRVHYTKHHQGYVTNLNNALKNQPQKSLDSILMNVSKYPTAVRNNAGGHFNHTLFWECLTPGGKELKGDLLQEITKTYGSLDSLQKLMTAQGTTLFGSGWVWLIVNKDNKLQVITSINQDNPIMDLAPIQGTPILGIDVWEHAYYLKYQNKRADYLKNIWKIINWEFVSTKYLDQTKKWKK